MISERPSVFFDRWISNAFPGSRGLQWILSSKDALDGLQRLFSSQFKFDTTKGYEVYRDPIAWFRGGSGGSLNSFRILNSTKCLLNYEELLVDKIAVFRSGSYKRSFVYIESRPDAPTGLYPVDDETISHRVHNFGYADEQFALYKNRLISSECYFDGGVIVDGVREDTRGAELRKRYLSRYNLLIGPKFSPMLDSGFGQLSEPILNDMLLGNDQIESIVDAILAAPIQPQDI